MKKPFILALFVLAVAVAVVASNGARPVEAHALLVRADPPANAQVREAPTVLSLFFSEALEHRFTTARVVDGSGERVDTSVEFDASDDALMRVNIKPAGPGYLTVNWETLSAVDGHRITGSYPLTILNPDGSRPPGSPAAATASVSGGEAKPTRVVTKWVLLLASSALAGSLFFVAIVLPNIAADHPAATSASRRRCLKVAGIAVIVMLLGGIAEVIIQAEELGGLGDLSQVIENTTWGERWLVRNVLLLPIAAGIFSLTRTASRSAAERLGIVGVSALVLGYMALVSSVSHGAAVTGAFWAASADFVHLIAACIWVGMLLQLALLLLWVRKNLVAKEMPPVVAPALQRFSLVALLSVALLIVTGTFSAVVELAKFTDLLDAAYGRALLIKLLLLIPLGLAAGANAYLFRPQIVDEANRRRRSPSADATLGHLLSRTMKMELALLTVIFLVVGVLYQLPPTKAARAAPNQVAGKYVELKDADNISVTLQIDPNEPGDNTYSTYLAGAVEFVESVTLKFRPAGDVTSESRLILDASNPPTFYVGRGPFLNTAGEWEVIVNLRRSRGADLDVPFKVPVGGVGATDTRTGGAFAVPRGLSVTSLAVMGVSILLAVGLVVGSLPRPGLPAGYMEIAARRVERVRISPALGLAILVLIGGGMGLAADHIHKRLSREEAAVGNPVQSTPESVERGRQLFLANCIMCHGESGRGDGPLAKSLTIQPANLYDHIPYHPDQFFYSVITNGLSNIMPAFGSSLSDEDRWNILNYLREQFGQPPPAQ